MTTNSHNERYGTFVPALRLGGSLLFEIRRLAVSSAVLAVASTGVVLTDPSLAVAVSFTQPAVTSSTHFGFGASAFGTKAKLNPAAANSGRTAWAYLGCTNQAGVTHGNKLAGTTIGGNISVSGVKSRSWTHKVGARVASNAATSIAKVRMGPTATPLVLKGVTVSGTAYHTKTGFHRSGRATIRSATLGGVAFHINKTRGAVTVVPGVGELTFLGSKGKAYAHHAVQLTQAVRI